MKVVYKDVWLVVVVGREGIAAFSSGGSSRDCDCGVYGYFWWCFNYEA